MTNDLIEEQTATRQAEAALLGSILIESACTEKTPTCLYTIRQMVKPEDFQDANTGEHYRIYQAMLNCPHPDQVCVAQELARQGTLKAGDCAYLCHLVVETPTSLDWLYYAEAVREWSQKRRLRTAAANGNTRQIKRLANTNAFSGGIEVADL